MEVEDQTGPLIQVYVIVAWAAIVLVAVVSGLIYRRIAVADLVYETEGRSVALVQQFISTSWPELRALAREAPELSADELREHREAEEAGRALLTLAEAPAVLKVRLYGALGLIVASTEISEIGRHTSDAVVLEMAAGRWWSQGRPGAESRLERIETFQTQDETLRNVDLVITHVMIRRDPVTPDRTGEAVLAIYQEVGAAMSRIRTTQFLAMGSLIVAATLVGGVIRLRRRRTGQ